LYGTTTSLTYFSTKRGTHPPPYIRLTPHSSKHAIANRKKRFFCGAPRRSRNRTASSALDTGNTRRSKKGKGIVQKIMNDDYPIVGFIHRNSFYSGI